MRVVARFTPKKPGAVAIEYALIASIIGIAIVFAVLGIGGKLTEMFGAYGARFT
jgi:Flp pilus assembly pilin Flp